MNKETRHEILQVLTSHDQLGNTGRKSGFWLEQGAARSLFQSLRGVLLAHRVSPFMADRVAWAVGALGVAFALTIHPRSIKHLGHL